MNNLDNAIMKQKQQGYEFPRLLAEAALLKSQLAPLIIPGTSFSDIQQIMDKVTDALKLPADASKLKEQLVLLLTDPIIQTQSIIIFIRHGIKMTTCKRKSPTTNSINVI